MMIVAVQAIRRMTGPMNTSDGLCVPAGAIAASTDVEDVV